MKTWRGRYGGNLSNKSWIFLCFRFLQCLNMMCQIVLTRHNRGTRNMFFQCYFKSRLFQSSPKINFMNDLLSDWRGEASNLSCMNALWWGQDIMHDSSDWKSFGLLRRLRSRTKAHWIRHQIQCMEWITMASWLIQRVEYLTCRGRYRGQLSGNR